ncbi:GNAT family N-acetyltransferase [Jannaschia sp. S6380]|uniref:GNAT family N-acetyltransferase n=1 Tax=Jannaschia sp. S6380 TaxID=2926408 RepID=UPI001FF54FC6|nr:GNAT family N-acetyltransferase [Jannaschia sp. S6380]MCK0167546.1 GNAT family N-acetyltransferase [Jannaschia sp. S6380]
MLTAGFHDVPAGHVAAIVTHLRMDSRPSGTTAPFPAGVALEPVEAPDPDWYRDLFMRVGGRDWLWSSRLRMDRAELGRTLNHEGVEIFAPTVDGRAEGLLELDFRDDEACELAFFGLTSALQGSGVGRALMGAALDRAFARPITHLEVHTCTLDSPVALPFYLRAGFVPVRREVEIMPDPRLDGTLPTEAADHHPVLRGTN